MKKWTTLMLARAGIIAALYVALSYAVLPVASGAIQFRISEALTILPLFYVESIPALFIGCLLSNLLTGCLWQDIVFGSLTTLCAGIFTHLVGRALRNSAKHYLKIALGGLFPVLMNALILPLIWLWAYGDISLPFEWAAEYSTLILYGLQVAFLLLSQSVAIYVCGSLLYALFVKLERRLPDLFGSTRLKRENN